MIGTNSENEHHRFLVKELVVDGKSYAPAENRGVKIEPLEIAGSYAKDHEAIAAKINEIIEALSK